MNPEIPGYKIIKHMGSSPQGSVYLAKREGEEQQVVLKVLHLGDRDSEDVAQSFINDAECLRNLNHPNIVNIYDIDKHQDFCYFTMEYLSGGNLESRLCHGMDTSEALNLIYGISDALEYAHSRSCLHGTFNPGSILCNASGGFVLTQLRPQSSALANAADYGSPEGALSKTRDARSDIYSVGALFYQVLTGHPLYQADSQEALAIKHISAPTPKLPEPYQNLQSVLDKFVAKNPEHRYQNATEVKSAIGSYLKSSETESLDESETNPPRLRFTKRNIGLFAGVATASLSLIFALIIFGDRPTHLEERVSDLIQEPPPKPQPQPHLQIEVAGQLAEAQAAEKNGKLEDAFLHYKQILTIDPSNKDSLKGTRRIAGVHLDQAYAAVTEEKNVEKARTKLEQALIIAPNHPYANEVQDRLADLETDLQTQLQQERLAAEQSQITLSLDAALEKNDLAEAKSQLQRLQSTAPEHQTLETYQSAVADLIKSLAKQKLELLSMASANAIPKQPNQDSTDWLLNKAEVALNNNNLMLPEGDNAYYYYAKILDRTPNQKQAMAGLETITKKYLQLASNSIDQGQLDMATTYLDRGSMIVTKYQLNTQLSDKVTKIKAEVVNQRQIK